MLAALSPPSRQEAPKIRNILAPADERIPGSPVRADRALSQSTCKPSPAMQCCPTARARRGRRSGTGWFQPTRRTGTREGNGATSARGSESQSRHLYRMLSFRDYMFQAPCDGGRAFAGYFIAYRRTHPARSPEVRVRRFDDFFSTAVQYRARHGETET